MQVFFRKIPGRMLANMTNIIHFQDNFVEIQFQVTRKIKYQVTNNKIKKNKVKCL